MEQALRACTLWLWLDLRFPGIYGHVDEVQALRSRLNAFQVAQGLKPDGLAGPLTLMQINRATGVDEPQLQDER